MDFLHGLSMTVEPIQRQEVKVYFLLFHDGLNSPTRTITYFLFRQIDAEQYIEDNKLIEIWQNIDPLALHVTEGAFIGLAVPTNRSPNVFTQTINLSPTSERVEAHIYQLTSNFSESDGRVLEAATRANSSQFTPQMIALPLIDVSVSKCWSAHAHHVQINTYTHHTFMHSNVMHAVI